MSRIVIVEDEDALRGDLVDYMHLQGFDAAGVGTAGELKKTLEEQARPDVVILDITLPDGDGFHLAETIRARLDCGIIMLTAHGDTESRVRGFDSGADIYLVKHSSLREITAAVHSLLRRLPQNHANDGQAGTWVLDTVSWTLLCPDGSSVKLTATENAFIGALIENSGTPRSREELARILSRRQTQFDNRHLDAVVSRLRRKILDQTDADPPIKSVYGVGYSFSAAGKIGSLQPGEAGG